MVMDTTESPEQVDVRHLPGFYVDALTPLVHRRAAEAALLRDRRLELALDDEGETVIKMVG
jgi:hypothetical protein